MGAIVFCVAFVTTMICATVFLVKITSDTIYERKERIDAAKYILRKTTNFEPLNDKDYEILDRLIK